MAGCAGGCAGKKLPKFDPIAVLVTLVYLVGVIFNNVGGTMMSYVMLGYPGWLLYGTTIMSTAVVGVVAVLIGERPFARSQLTWPRQVVYLKLLALTVANGFAFQFAAGFVSGDLSQLLLNMGMPAVLVLSLICFRNLKFSVREGVGTGLVFAAVLVGSLVDLLTGATNGTDANASAAATTMAPVGNSTTAASVSATQSNEWYWIVLFLLSTVFQGGLQIVQEQAFAAKLSPWTTVFWSNLYAVPVYFVGGTLMEAIPILNGKATGTTVAQAFTNQGYAFACFLGFAPESEIARGACVPVLATIWPLVFVVGYVLFFGVGAMLIQKFSSHGGAFFVVLITALGSPLAAAVFSIPEIVGEANFDSVKWYTYVCFAVVAVGVFVKGTPEPNEEVDSHAGGHHPHNHSPDEKEPGREDSANSFPLAHPLLSESDDDDRAV